MFEHCWKLHLYPISPLVARLLTLVVCTNSVQPRIYLKGWKDTRDIGRVFVWKIRVSPPMMTRIHKRKYFNYCIKLKTQKQQHLKTPPTITTGWLHDRRDTHKKNTAQQLQETSKPESYWASKLNGWRATKTQVTWVSKNKWKKSATNAATKSMLTCVWYTFLLCCKFIGILK